jgi:hypothetical protein
MQRSFVIQLIVQIGKIIFAFKIGVGSKTISLFVKCKLVMNFCLSANRSEIGKQTVRTYGVSRCKFKRFFVGDFIEVH